MAKLLYSALASLDGYIEDSAGNFDWAAPDEEVHRFFNDLERPVSTHLYGRRMYETMAVWETEPGLAAMSPYARDYADIWQAADKIVFSRTLPAVMTARTRIERDFNPEAVRQLKMTSERDIGIGGADLAGQAFTSGLIDEVHLVLAPIAVGSGKPALPIKTHLPLKLLEERRFGNGMVYLRYQAQP